MLAGNTASLKILLSVKVVPTITSHPLTQEVFLKLLYITLLSVAAVHKARAPVLMGSRCSDEKHNMEVHVADV